jgi:hypothetical protein
VVPLRLGLVQRGQHVELTPRHGDLSSQASCLTRFFVSAAVLLLLAARCYKPTTIALLVELSVSGHIYRRGGRGFPLISQRTVSSA